MAFSGRNYLMPRGYGVWSYRTNDTTTDMLGAGYFSAAYDVFETGDRLLVTTVSGDADSPTATWVSSATLVVTAISSAGVVTVAEQAAGMSQADADLRYLKLTADNDPLTDTLTGRALLPSADITYDIGAQATQYKNVWMQGLRSGIATTGTPTLTVDADSNVLGLTLQEDTGASVSATIGSGFGGAPMTVTGLIQTSGAASATVNATGFSSLAVTSIYSAPGPSIVNVTGTACLAVLGAGSETSATATATVGGNSSFGVGYSYSFGAGNATVSSTGIASALVGVAISVGATNAQVSATGNGCLVVGYTLGGTLQASNNGALCVGYGTGSGNITASGTGSVAVGAATGATISATAAGAVALGNANSNAITSSGLGSLAVGYATGAAIVASANNAVQFGPGTNSVADCVRIGNAGLRLKGTTGAFGTPANGDIYMGSTGNAYVLVHSNAQAIRLSKGSTYTQTYSTATTTHAALTSATLTDSTGGTANTTVAALAALTSATLTDSTTGTANTTVVDVGVAFNQATLNDNFADVVAQCNALRADWSAARAVLHDDLADIVAQVNALRVDLANVKQVVNTIIDDHQADNLAG